MIDTEAYQRKTCTWSLHQRENLVDPHIHSKPNPPKKIYSDVVEMIGNTPVVKLNRIPAAEGIKCEIVAKIEFFNPGGSLKDRVGKRTVHDLEKKGVIKPGYTLIEATSGNCGIGLAMLSAVKGYKAIITMPDKMSMEKKYILNSLGAECLRCPSDAPFNTPESHIGVAYKLNREIETSKFLDQYSDDSNALVNYDETADELWEQLDGKVDYVVLTVGTGGTITGIARKFKEKNPNVKIVGVDPVGSQMAMPKDLNDKKCNFKVEGIGYDFVPKNLDQDAVDLWYKCEDKDSFIMARRIIKEEGILAGGSSGSALWAAIDVAKNLPADKRVVVLFCDGIRNYLSKYISDDWMIENNYIEEEEIEKLEAKNIYNKIYGKEYGIKDIVNELKLEKAKTLDFENSIDQAISVMEGEGVDYIPVVSNGSQLHGVVSVELVTQKLLSGFVKHVDSVKRVMTVEYKLLDISEPLNRITRAFQKGKNFVMVKNSTDLYMILPDHLIEFMQLNPFK